MRGLRCVWPWYVPANKRPDYFRVVDHPPATNHHTAIKTTFLFKTRSETELIPAG